MADQGHTAILKQGVEAWNEWRKENPGLLPDLAGEDLIGLQIIILSLRSLGHDVFSRGIIAQRLPYLHWMSHQKP